MINSMILQGRLVRDADLKTVGNGTSLATFTVAWSESYKDKETKCFLLCKAWNGTADLVANYFHKGSEIVIDGRIETEEWEKDGEKKSRTVCNVNRVHFCGSKKDNESKSDNSANNSDTEFMNIPDGVEDDGLPFN